MQIYKISCKLLAPRTLFCKTLSSTAIPRTVSAPSTPRAPQIRPSPWRSTLHTLLSFQASAASREISRRHVLGRVVPPLSSRKRDGTGRLTAHAHPPFPPIRSGTHPSQTELLFLLFHEAFALEVLATFHGKVVALGARFGYREIFFIPLERLLAVFLLLITIGNGGKGGDELGIVPICFLVMLDPAAS